MDIDLELFQGPDQRYYGEYELDDVLRKATIRHFGDLSKHDLIHLTLDKPPDSKPYPGPPEVRNLAAEHGYCSLLVTRDGETVHDERMRIVELLGPVLARELSKLEPGEAQWGFVLRRRRLLALVLADNLVENLAGRLTGLERPVPEVKGSVEVDLAEPRHRPFTLTPMAREDAEVVRPEDLGLDPARLDTLNILMSADIRDQFLHRMPLESRMEEGGFLLGRVTKAGDQVHLVEITHVTPAHRSGAGMVHFTFTGESFLAVAKLLEERGQQEELVGWYHTHLFSIDLSMGLSSIDVDLHLATFQRPWQVAALINMRRRGRLLRFYGRGGEGLREYKQWVRDDSGRYRPADHALGGE